MVSAQQSLQGGFAAKALQDDCRPPPLDRMLPKHLFEARF